MSKFFNNNSVNLLLEDEYRREESFLKFQILQIETAQQLLRNEIKVDKIALLLTIILSIISFIIVFLLYYIF